MAFTMSFDFIFCLAFLYYVHFIWIWKTWMAFYNKSSIQSNPQWKQNRESKKYKKKLPLSFFILLLSRTKTKTERKKINARRNKLVSHAYIGFTEVWTQTTLKCDCFHEKTATQKLTAPILLATAIRFLNF